MGRVGPSVRPATRNTGRSQIFSSVFSSLFDIADVHLSSRARRIHVPSVAHSLLTTEYKPRCALINHATLVKTSIWFVSDSWAL